MGLISTYAMTPTLLAQWSHEDLAPHTIGYGVETVDGKRMGTVEDVLYDDEAGVARYVVVNTTGAEFVVNYTRILLPATLCCPNEERHTVRSEAGVEQVQRAPAYDPASALGRSYEETVFTNFGERPYWPI